VDAFILVDKLAKYANKTLSEQDLPCFSLHHVKKGCKRTRKFPVTFLIIGLKQLLVQFQPRPVVYCVLDNSSNIFVQGEFLLAYNSSPLI
jgi:hypothetical protein